MRDLFNYNDFVRNKIHTLVGRQNPLLATVGGHKLVFLGLATLHDTDYHPSRYFKK